MNKSEEECDEPEFSGYMFTRNEIKNILEYSKCKDGCPHCGHGESHYVIAEMVTGFLVIRNWCGCLTYGPTYIADCFSTIIRAREHVEQFKRNREDQE